MSRALWPTRQHDVIGGDALAVCEHHAAHSAWPSPAIVEVRHLALEAVFAAQRFDGLRACFSTIVTRRNVPICGLATYRISGGAPALTNSVSTLRPRCAGP